MDAAGLELLSLAVGADKQIIGRSDVKFKPRVSFGDRWIGYKDFSYGIRETDCHRLRISKPAGVIVQFGQSEDIASDLFDIRVSMLDINPQRHWRFPTWVCSQARYET
jgi:hypothetical protein